MKKLIFILISIVTFVNSITSQIEFGETGSFWNYTFSPHNGNGGGWDVIIVEGDTIVDNESFKILHRNYYRYIQVPYEEYYGSSYFGLMKITDDSVFVNGNLILDFTMEIDDSLFLDFGSYNLKLAIDSITSEEISGIQFQKWHGQKICLAPSDTFVYETFQILENIGQIGSEYLLWNTDGCIIGGGGRSFKCYRNGDFSYPPNMQCNQFMIVNINEIELLEEIQIYPNPSLNLLNIENNNLQIQLISVYDFTGREVLQEICNSNLCRLNIESFIPGIYFIGIDTKKGKHLEKFIKK